MAVRTYVAQMADAGIYPGLNGYQRAARERVWPSSKTVVARLGSWSDALLAAGFQAVRRPAEVFVSREECVGAVAAYAREATQRGKHPGSVGYERVAASRRWPSLTTVTVRLGSWTAALSAAGVSGLPDRRPGYDTCLLAVAAYVEEAASAGVYPGLRGYEARATRRSWPSSGAVTARCGSWPSALRLVGFSGPLSSGRAPVTRDHCVAAIEAYVAEATKAGRHPGVIGYDAVSTQRGWPQRQSTVMARFGSWSAALLAAGYGDPIHQRSHRVSRDQCLQAVDSYLAEMTEAHLSPTLAGYGKLARSRGWPAVATQLARLGSWQEALRLSTREPALPDTPAPDPVGSSSR